MGLTLSLRNTPSWALYWVGAYSVTGTWTTADQVTSPILPIGTPWTDLTTLPASGAQGFNLLITNTNDFTSPALRMEEKKPRIALSDGGIYTIDWAGGIPKSLLIGGSIVLGGLLLMAMLRSK